MQIHLIISSHTYSHRSQISSTMTNFRDCCDGYWNGCWSVMNIEKHKSWPIKNTIFVSHCLFNIYLVTLSPGSGWEFGQSTHDFSAHSEILSNSAVTFKWLSPLRVSIPRYSSIFSYSFKGKTSPPSLPVKTTVWQPPSSRKGMWWLLSLFTLPPQLAYYSFWPSRTGTWEGRRESGNMKVSSLGMAWALPADASLCCALRYSYH